MVIHNFYKLLILVLIFLLCPKRCGKHRAILRLLSISTSLIAEIFICCFVRVFCHGLGGQPHTALASFVLPNPAMGSLKVFIL